MASQKRNESSQQSSRHTSLATWLTAKLTNPRGEILDYGAGDGYLLEELSRAQNCRLSYFDPTETAYRAATKRLANLPITLFSAESDLPSDTFDMVISTAVWMCFATWSECVSYLKSINRVLKINGKALLAVTHPCFRDRRYASFSTNFSAEAYLSEGTPFVVHTSRTGAASEIHDFHWNLSTMFRQMREAHLRVENIDELAPRSARSKGAFWLCIEAIKEEC